MEHKEQPKDRKIRVYRSRFNRENPCIIMQGKWLAEMGYNAGDYLRVKYNGDHIEIYIDKRYIVE